MTQQGVESGSFLALGFDGRFLYSVAKEGAAAWDRERPYR